ncbi:IPT/TIG domain-containing protein [Actinoplanes sp. NBC_00393]|uniref:beta strand repeat-containing protein n=1 Tax=Actinoplanes sp. NBC_00393 TaxID=2975953 RepID=UPI002E1B6D39
MRKSKTKARLARAGLATGVVGASLLVAPGAAAAAALTSITPNNGPAGLTVTVTASNTTGNTTSFAGTTPAMLLGTGGASATCPASPSSPPAGFYAATSPTKTGAGTATFVIPPEVRVPTGGTPVAYRACVYNDTYLVDDDPANIFTVKPTFSAISHTSGPAGLTLTVTTSASTGNNTSFAGTTPALLLRAPGTATACPANASSPPAGFTAATSPSKVGANSATFVVPTTLKVEGGNAPSTYRLCVYNDTNKLIEDPAHTFTVTPALNPAGGPSGTTVTVEAPVANAFAGGTPAAIFTTASSCPTNYSTTAASGQTVGAATSPTKVDNNTATFNVPTTFALSSTALSRAVNLCVYVGSAADSALAVATPQPFLVTPNVTTNPTTGAAGNTNNITFSVPTATGVFTAAPAVRFSANGCAATYGTSSGPEATSEARTSNTVATGVIPAAARATAASTPYSVCAYAGTASDSALIGVSANAYTATVPSPTLSATIGKAEGGNGITATSTSNFLLGVTTPGVTFTAGERCPERYNPITDVNRASPSARRLANNRMAITVPDLRPLVNSEPTPYTMCVYDSTNTSTSVVVAAATYTAATVQTLDAVSPGSGSSLGGTEIVVTGTNFPTTANSITATLGGEPLLNVTPVDTTKFTATTPMHVAEDDVSLVVTTFAGTATASNAFDYQDTIESTPNTAPNTLASIDLTVKGVGFGDGEDFDGTLGGAHIYLTRGVYDPTDTGSGRKVNGPVSECGDVLVISDTELVCNLRLNRRLNATGNIARSALTLTPALTVVTGSRVLTSGTDIFSASDVGKPIAQISGAANAIPAGAVITDVVTAKIAVISKNIGGAGGSDVVAVVGAPSTAVETNSTVDTNTDNTLVADALVFTSADIGSLVVGPGLTAGATILAVSGNTATISANTTATASNQAFTIVAPSGVVRANATIDTSNDDTLSADVGTFSSADVGATIIGGGGIAADTVITAVNTDGSEATISQASSGGGVSNVKAVIISPLPVPAGAYSLTYVSDGDVGATGAGYSQSVVSNASTFTVTK